MDRSHTDPYDTTDLPPSLVEPYFTETQRISAAMEDVLSAAGSFVAINNRVSQSVPHLHVHIVPRRKKDGLKGFFWPRHPYQNEDQVREAQQAIREALGAAD